MRVILISKIVGLGNLGDEINVKPGYARNFLIPFRKAVPATKKNLEYFKTRRFELEVKLAEDLKQSKLRADKINALGSITIASKAGDEGKLFGSIGKRDIARAIIAAGIEVRKNEIRLPNGVLRTIGEHEVNFYLHNEIFAKIIVNIIKV